MRPQCLDGAQRGGIGRHGANRKSHILGNTEHSHQIRGKDQRRLTNALLGNRRQQGLQQQPGQTLLPQIASNDDGALLEDLTRHPERREGLMSWGLQYIVRGDILLNDGTTVTLDELANELKRPALPYVDDPGLPMVSG